MATKSPPWKKKASAKKGTGKKLTQSQKSEAKARAKKAGRSYPNLVDNMAVAKKAKKAKKDK